MVDVVHSAVASRNGAAPGLALGAVFLLFPVLGWWKVAIGVALLVRALFRLFAQVAAGTFPPLLVLPDAWCRTSFPHALTTAGSTSSRTWS